MIVLVVSTPGGRVPREGLSEIPCDWTPELAVVWPVTQMAYELFEADYGVYPDRVVALLPAGALSCWDPSAAIQVADHIVSWAFDNGHSLILRGERVAAAFDAPVGAPYSMAGVDILGVPIRPDADPEWYQALVQRYIEDTLESQ